MHTFSTFSLISCHVRLTHRTTSPFIAPSRIFLVSNLTLSHHSCSFCSPLFAPADNSAASLHSTAFSSIRLESSGALLTSPFRGSFSISGCHISNITHTPRHSLPFLPRSDSAMEMTITNLQCTSSLNPYHGSIVSPLHLSSFSVTNSSFLHCTTVTHRQTFHNTPCTLTDTTFTVQSADVNGGAISITGNGAMNITRCTFFNCSMSGSGFPGGALHFAGTSTIEMTHTTFEQCISHDSHAGAFFLNGTSSTTRLTHFVVFDGRVAAQ